MIEDLKALLGLPEEIDGALENKIAVNFKGYQTKAAFPSWG